jgi:hypothetical protein
MRKIIILPLMFICMMFAALAYTVVDYDSFDYTGGSSLLYANGWRNDSVGSIDQCQALSGYMFCAGTGSNKVIYHTLNQKPVGYCVSKNGSYGDFARNFSIRYQIAMVDSAKTSSDIVWSGSGQYINTTYNGRFQDLMTRIYANYSGYSARPEDFLWETTGAITAPIVRDTVMGDWHTVQMDFFVTNASFPIGAQNIYLGNISVINSTGLIYNHAGSIPTMTDYFCLNASYFRFNTDFKLDNFYMVEYNESEYFIPINQSITIGTTYQCSDGIDNDADSFIDMDDPSCDSVIDNSESPYDSTECNDGEDNDGDYLIDYPADPSCSGFSDNSEAPKNTFQCNDGQDNDGDGYIDYPVDPSCASPSENSELPADNSVQTEDTCSSGQGCIMLETFPYSDTIYYHNWTDLGGSSLPNVAYIKGGYSLLIQNYDGSLNTISLIKDFQNDASLFSDITGDILFEAVTNSSYTCGIACQKNHTLYILFDGTSMTAIAMKLVFIDKGSGNIDVEVYNLDNESNEDYIETKTLTAANGLFNVQFKLDIYSNPNDNTITINNYISHFYNATTPTRIRVYTNDYDSRPLQVYMHYIKINGQLSGASVCSTFKPPYYLKEEFTYSYLQDCGWTVTPSSLYVQGGLDIDNSIDYFSAYKGMYDSISSSYVKLTNRYSTLSFSINPKSTSDSVNAFSFFIYDYAKNIVSSFNFDRSGNVYHYPDGSPELLTTIATDTTSNIKIVFDIINDKFDFYVNNALIAQSKEFYNTEFNYEDLFAVYLTSAYSAYSVDNLAVYTSDASGSPMIASATINLNANNQTYLWGILYKATPACVQDSDCPSGQCTGYKKCASLNYKMCDEYGYNRTNWCFFKLMVAKSLEWVVNLILDNFLLFLGLLIILMFSLFFLGHLRRR